jgi:hypothetical protein
MREHPQGDLVHGVRRQVEGPVTTSSGPAGIGMAQSLSEARRRPATLETRCDYRATPGSVWSYYVFRQGHRTLQKRGNAQRLSINGVPEALALER